MKKNLFNFSLLLSFLSVGLSEAQSYFPLPDSNYVWSVSASLGLFGSHSNYKYVQKGDSVQGSHTYTKYYVTSDTNMTASSLSFFALVRQDQATRKVFAIPGGSSSEKLLYDFSVPVNGTVTVFPLAWASNSAPNMTVKITAKDSVLINSQYKKRLKIQGFWWNFTLIPEYWIEGIGSTTGLFDPGASGVIIVDANICYPRLLCLQNGSMTAYADSLYTCNKAVFCQTIVAVPEQSKLSGLKIFPNPSSGMIKLFVEKQVTGNYKFSIRNVLSVKVFQGEWTGEGEREVDLSELKMGIYFLEISDNGKLIAREKILKE